MKDPKVFEVSDTFTNLENGRSARVVQVLGPNEYCYKYTDGQEPSRGSCNHSIMWRGSVHKDIMPVELPIIEESIAAVAAPVEPEAAAAPAPAPEVVGVNPAREEDNAVWRAEHISDHEKQRIYREYEESLKIQAAKREKEEAERWHDPFPGLPAELKSHNRWGLFKKIWDEKKQKYDKIPYSALTVQMGNFFEKDKGADYRTACNLFRKNPAEWGGIGYGFNKEYGFTGIDLDNCIDAVTHEIVTME